MAKAQKAAKKKAEKVSKKKIKKVEKKPVEKKPSVKKKAAKEKTKAEPTKKQPKRQATTKKKAAIVVAYNKTQLEQFREWKHKLQTKTNAELKEMCKKNDQTCSGTKDDLIEKIADGKVLGKIPRCQHCFGGRLRFDWKTGIYNCPGYRDDTDFHNCQKKFTLGEITRDTWID